MRAGARIHTPVTAFIAAVGWALGAAALSPGSLDPGFGSGGTVQQQFAQGPGGSIAYTIVSG